MRLRRIAAAATAGAVVFASTAAVFPSSQVDTPQPIPALTAQALGARYTADTRMIAQAGHRAAGRSGDTSLARALDQMRGQHFIDFNPSGSGLAVEVVGDLARARRVAILVPRSDTSLTTFDARGTAWPEGAARALAAEAHRLDPRASLAIIAWLGYAAGTGSGRP